jgi:hypothetical protein
MKKTKTTLCISLLFFGLFFVFTPIAKAEVIRDFNSTITVLPDSSILVNEKITYNFESSIRHGIYRNIPLKNSKNEIMDVHVISVKDDMGEAYKFTESNSNEVLTIKIGDPDRVISGIKEYDIIYKVFGSIGYYDNFDEIYWNATGNDWEVPIEKASAHVVLPINVSPIKQACYYGKSGSTTNCKIINSNDFTVDTLLKSGEGLTVAVGFPKGVVSVYKAKVESKSSIFIETFWPLLIPILIFIFMFIRWFKIGRDPKGRGVIIAQYDVPEKLTPLEVGGIVNDNIKNKNISAEIIYLATRGFIKIKQIDDKILGLIPKKDYEFTLLKEEGLLENTFDKKIITAIFGDNGEVGGTALLSSLKDSFYKSILSIDNAVIDTLLSKKYFTNLPKISTAKIMSIFIFGIFINFFFRFNSFKNVLNILVFILSLSVSTIIYLVFDKIMPAKSTKGVSIMEYLLGLKEYLQIAEKDRINFHNAPDKKPEIFEVLLPYAMVFGVEEAWAKEFKDIYISPPGWYESNTTGFSVISFGHEMAIFNTFATTSLSSSPSNGSGGGGFSGGGGGGGGGGSW